MTTCKLEYPKIEDFVALILTHGRPDNVKTYQKLRDSGYTGAIRLLVDDQDEALNAYKDRYGSEVVVFSKAEAALITDSGDNFRDFRCVLYARNASFDCVRSLGFKSFVQLDDDYSSFHYRFNSKLEYIPGFVPVLSLDNMFMALVRFLERTTAHSIAIAQGGDFIGGSESRNAESVRLLRKCMNSFVCLVERPFKFLGRINEDTTMYVDGATKGILFFTTNQVSLIQAQTQDNAGGLTDIYKDYGTYVKSFYTVMYQPSCTKVRLMGAKHKRLHHSVTWKNAAPRIVSDSLRRTD